MSTNFFPAIILTALLIISPLTSYSLTLTLPANGDNVVGYNFVIQSKTKDTLRSIGRRYDIGFQQMRLANPELPTDKYLLTNTDVIIPAMMILPPGPREGVVVSLAEYRLFYFPKHSNTVVTFPIGIGKTGWETPTFSGTIIRKQENPSWYVPDSVREFNLKQGITLPKIFPPGPNNPLGQFALYTSQPGYLIHGTNRPLGVGDRVSSGCVRLAPENIKSLFQLVPTGTSLRVIHTPYTIGTLNGQLYLQAFPVLTGYDDTYHETTTPLVNQVLLATNNDTSQVDWNKVTAIAAQADGIPSKISGSTNAH